VSRKNPFHAILSSTVAAALADQVVTLFDPPVREYIRTSGIDVTAIVRFQAVARRCREARENKSQTIKDVAVALKVPQYRLRAIEEVTLSEVIPEILDRYIEYLGLSSWYARWRRATRR
jgi:hypothetical protein